MVGALRGIWQSKAMTLLGLVWKSFRFHARSHLGTMLGAAVAVAVLTGALLVGDSVRGSLRRLALERLGELELAAHSGDRLFRAQLGQELASQAGTRAAAGLLLLGTVATPDGSGRANQVQVAGMSADFFEAAGKPALSDGLWINQRLARHLRAEPGQTLLVRVPRATQISRDAPLSPAEDASATLRLELKGIIPDDRLGNFSLAASQAPPFNVFVPLPLLQQRSGATNQANLLVTSRGTTTSHQIDTALQSVFTLEDAQLQALEVPKTKGSEIRTPRVFLDDASARGALGITPNQPVLTYFVNSLSLGTNRTPYSMVTATTAPLVPADLKTNEIVINQWLADDLGANPGDELAVAYYRVGLMRELVEHTNIFKVRAIVPMNGPHGDSSLMPDFPGLANSENCRDWDTGFPIDTSAIRDKDEAYWDEHRGTPKAFISLEAGQAIWENRFGKLTAVRYPAATPAELTAKLRPLITPPMAGLSLLPVREQALTASRGATDFGQLFLGFSFFLIGAALILVSLLFRFAVEQRRDQLGTLLALGFTPRLVRRALLLEGILVALAGSIIGLLAGIGYAKAMLLGLSTIWRDAIGSSALSYHGNPISLAIGAVAGIIVATATIARVLRQETKRTAQALLSQGETESLSGAKRGLGVWIGIGAIVLSLGLTGYAITLLPNARADLFFGAGALLLIGGLALCSGVLLKAGRSRTAGATSLLGLGMRGISRRPSRSRAVIGLLACGAFMIAAIGAFRLEPDEGARRNSGTGGFALIGESALPVVQNLNAQAGREFYNLDAKLLGEVRFVPFRVLEGEDASCLNLNRAQRPRILGVNSTLLAERKAFLFKDALEGAAKNWEALDSKLPAGVVPAIGDAASIQYALGKKLGDDIDYVDELGRTFKVRLVGSVANSILQGNLVISERHFIDRFPSQSGYRFFLLDGPMNNLETIRAHLVKALGDAGFEATLARDRLAAFNAVQNTYLSTFQVLGGLGLVLGTIGLGVILLRNVYERRSELALLLAVGFQRKSLTQLVLAEHGALLIAGLVLGLLAAGIAVLPMFLTPGREFPLRFISMLLSTVFLVGVLSATLAAWVALRGEILPALRKE